MRGSRKLPKGSARWLMSRPVAWRMRLGGSFVFWAAGCANKGGASLPLTEEDEMEIDERSPSSFTGSYRQHRPITHGVGDGAMPPSVSLAILTAPRAKTRRLVYGAA